MNPSHHLSKLKILLARARRNAFFKADFQNLKSDSWELSFDYHSGVLLEQLKALFEYSLTVQAPEVSNLVEEELLLDRLLLACSPQYLRTRSLSRQLGARLEPRPVRRDEAYFQWDPAQVIIYFSPLETKMRRLLTDKTLTYSQMWKSFNEMRDLVASTFHELNHHILFSHFRPEFGEKFEALSPQAKQKAVRLYYSFVESLVQTRDVEIAEDLGELGPLFRAPMVVNYALGEKEKPGATATLESFRTLALYLTLQNVECGEDRIRALFERAGFRLVWNDYFTQYNEESTFVQNKWFQNFSSVHEGRFRLPSVVPGSSFEILKWRFLEPEEIFGNPDFMESVYVWYKKLFPLKPSGKSSALRAPNPRSREAKDQV